MKSPQVIRQETKPVSELITRISSVMKHHHIFHVFICLVSICKNLRSETPFGELNKKSDKLYILTRHAQTTLLFSVAELEYFPSFFFQKILQFFGINLA